MNTEQVKELLAKWLEDTTVSDSIAEQIISEFGSIARLSVEEEIELLEAGN
jgi:hypothetical protein